MSGTGSTGNAGSGLAEPVGPGKNGAFGEWLDRARLIGQFFQIARKDLMGVGGAWPVSDRTVRRLIDLAALKGGEIVMDAGAGHGNVALALLCLSPGPSRVYSVERSPEMFRFFLKRMGPAPDSRLIPVEADIRDVGALLDGDGGRVDAVISTIPVSRASRMDDVFRAFAGILKPGGKLVQVSSDPFHCPRLMREAGFRIEKRLADWYGLLPFFLFSASLRG